MQRQINKDRAKVYMHRGYCVGADVRFQSHPGGIRHLQKKETSDIDIHVGR